MESGKIRLPDGRKVTVDIPRFMRVRCSCCAPFQGPPGVKGTPKKRPKRTPVVHLYSAHTELMFFIGWCPSCKHQIEARLRFILEKIQEGVTVSRENGGLEEVITYS
jgi:thiol-disulfide isomerase/thioredoxin